MTNIRSRGLRQSPIQPLMHAVEVLGGIRSLILSSYAEAGYGGLASICKVNEKAMSVENCEATVKLL